ncbi:MAG: hypothetical protein C4K58_00745 [Flavobacteriaceae bacterium]|nr:MAG: hypothetical protein C4K58_00745 [Flavobacteriaceae bacterium]
MKVASTVVLVLSVVLLLVGAYFDLFTQVLRSKNLAYGFGTLLFFFVWMPLFLFSRKGKSKFYQQINPSEKED